MLCFLPRLLIFAFVETDCTVVKNKERTVGLVGFFFSYFYFTIRCVVLYYAENRKFGRSTTHEMFDILKILVITQTLRIVYESNI